MKTCELIIYTSNGALTFEVEATTDNFQDALASALEGGTVVLDTTDESKLILNAINVVAIEVREVVDDKSVSNTPPVSKMSAHLYEPCSSPFCDRPERV